jgi:flagellar assembly protein FliH
MDSFIPKENLTAYERWELAAFDEQQPPSQAAKTGPASTPVAPPPAAPTAEEIERIRSEARAAGHQEGLAKGLAEGRAAGEAQGRTALNAEIARFTTLIENRQRAFEALEEATSVDVLDLALAIAKQLIRASLKVQPALILPVVREAMAALVSQHGHPSLLLNPADAALVRDHLGDNLQHTGWRILDDPAIERGGCRVENVGSEVDATLATRWHRIVDGLGGRTDWLDQGPETPR